MATIMHYPPSKNFRGSYKGKIEYVLKENKVGKDLIYGKDLLGETKEEFIQEFREVKEDWGKLDGRQYYHIVQAFEKEEYVTAEEAHQVGIEWVEQNKALEGYQVIVATHVDEDHFHNHFVINSVNLDTGKKFGYNQREMLEGKELSNEICLEHNFKTIELNLEREIKTHELRYSLQELAIMEKGEVSWKENMRTSLQIAEARTIDLSIENNIEDRKELLNIFKEELSKEGIEISRGLAENSKTITFKDLEGHKCRGDKLDLYYTNMSNIGNNLELEREQNKEKLLREEKNKELRNQLNI